MSSRFNSSIVPTLQFARVHRLRRAFSLIELLVVMVVVGILSMVLIPAVRSVRDQAHQVEGLSNLRGIGALIHQYAAENEYELPVAWRQSSPSTDYAITLSGMIDGAGSTYGTRSVPRAAIFRDPSLEERRGTMHFSAHPGLLTSASTPVPVALQKVHNQMDLIILMDGTLSAAGSANATAGNVSSIRTYMANFSGDLNAPVPMPEDDNNLGAGYIRWSRKRVPTAKFLFVDGRVEVLKKGDLKYRNIVVDY